MIVTVQPQDFDIAAEIKTLTQGRTDIGAIVTFTGLVRDFHGDKLITQMTLEHFPGMAEKQLTKICTEAEERWPLMGGCIIHRYGPLDPGDNIVLVITLSAHRDSAFEGAEYIMDWLKTDAPFWKKEQTTSGENWVNAKEKDDKRKDRWT